MPCLSVNILRASAAAFVLVFALLATAAEKEKDKLASLMGITKEQVYSRLGEPRRQLKAGAREIMYFPGVKVTLRNNVVVETEEQFDEPAPPPPRRPAEVPAAVPSPADTSDATDSTKARKAGAPQPAIPAPAAAAEPTVPAKPSDASAESKPSVAPAGSGGLEIKFVRPSAANVPRPALKAPVKAGTAATTPAPKQPSAAAPAATSATSTPSSASSSLAVAPAPPMTAQVASSAAAMPSATSSGVPSALSTGDKPVATAEAPETVAEPDATAATKKKTPPRRFFRRHVDPDTELPEVTLFTPQTYVFGFAVVGAIAFLIWRSRQRSLELAATTVSNTPFSEPAAADTSALFTAQLLAKLEWKRFEELIAAYYVKTGVVAVRTKTGPESPVHLKISWKGEAKPFACVQCHASPAGLIRAEPLHGLFAALTAADIRRGYVVTNGKFNVEARDFAEEKHFTLLPGDLLLEKLNALPAAARSELMQETTAGDYTTPTCPKCDVRMVRAADDGWRCANQPRCEATMPARKA